MEFPELLVAGRARQLFLTYNLVCFLKPNSWIQWPIALFPIQFTSKSDVWNSSIFLTVVQANADEIVLTYAGIKLVAEEFEYSLR